MPVTTPARPAPPKRKRGRESPLDMVRSLGLVLLIVIPVWFLAKPPAGDSERIRVVDPTADIASFRQAAPGVPVPDPPPAGWQATSSTLEPGALRIGFVVPGDTYAEYAASTAPAAQFLPDITGTGREVGTLVLDGVTWRQVRDSDEHTSLVREVGGGTVVVGGVRETAGFEQLRVLAAAVG